MTVELVFREPVDPCRLNGCGMLLINPPYRFEAELPPILAALLDRLGNREPASWPRSGGLPMSSVAVIGAGAWGTALAIQAARAGNQVTLWARDPARAASIAANRDNPRLPGVRLPADTIVTARPDRDRCDAARGSHAIHPYMLPNLPAAPLVIGAKGLESGTLRLPLEIAAEVRPDLPAAVLTGPNFAHEIAAGLPAASVIAASMLRCVRRSPACLVPPRSGCMATMIRSAPRSAVRRRT